MKNNIYFERGIAMEIGISSLKKIALILFGTVFFGWALEHFSLIAGAVSTIWGYIFPFVLGACLAFLLNIPMRSIENGLNKIIPNKNKKPFPRSGVRGLSIALTLLIVFGILTGLSAIIIPQISDAVLSLKRAVPLISEFFNNYDSWIRENLPILEEQIVNLNMDLSGLMAKFSIILQNVGETIINSSISVATSVFSGVVNFFLALIFAIYILFGKESLGKQFKGIIGAFVKERYAHKTFFILDLIDKTFTKFFTGQCLESVILGLMFLVGMTIFRFPYAAMISALVCVTALIPIFGAFIACFVGAFLIIVNNPMQAVWFVVFFLVMQQIEGNLVYPRVMGSSIGLPSLWVLLAVTIGGNMMGILGMLIFIPIFSVIYSLINMAVDERTKNKTKSLPKAE